MRRGFYAATQMASLLCAPLFVGLIIVTHDLVALAFGDRWLPVVPTIQILAFDAMLYCVFMFGDVVFTALGRPKSTLFRSCFHFAVSLIGLRVFHTSGLDAAALVWVGSSCLTLPLMLVKIRQLLFVDILRNIAQPFIAGSVMGIVLVSLKLHALEILDEPAAPRRSYSDRCDDLCGFNPDFGAVAYTTILWLGQKRDSCATGARGY